METVEEVYDRIAPNMSKAWGKKDVAMMVAKVYANQFKDMLQSICNNSQGIVREDLIKDAEEVLKQLK